MSRRPIRWWNPAALLAIVALVATVVLVGRALDQADKVNVADLAAVAIAAAVAAAAVVTWAKRRNTAAGYPADVTRAADVLADLVRRQWQDEARNRLLDDPEPIPVRWNLTANEAVMSTPRLISTATGFTFTGRSDDIAALARDFRTLTRRRLVITGGAGMGKTTLAIQLLLQLLSTRATDQTSASGDEIVPVPVLLPVSGWDTDAHPRLQDWLAVRLAADYPALAAPQLGAGAAAALAQRGHILPVLDGLDEIPAPARAQVIAALNASLTARDQLILTSRRAEFTTAVHDAGRPLTAAAVIVPKPLTPQAAADYLTACLPASPTEAWTHTLAALRSHTVPGLTRLSATPLGLWLIRTVYVASGADPAPLTGSLGADADALRTHLLDHVIPAVIAARPPSTDPTDHFRPRHRLDSDATRRYLTYLARAFPPATTRDITWWHIARTTSHIRPAVGLTFGLAFGLAAGLLPVVWVGELISWSWPGLVIGLAFGLMRAPSWVNETPGFANLRLRGRAWRPFRFNTAAVAFRLLVGLVVGLAFVPMLVLMTGLNPTDGLTLRLGLYVWLGITLAPRLVTWTEQPTLESTSTPRSSRRPGRTLTLLRTIVPGLAAGLAAWLAFGLTVGFGVGLGVFRFDPTDAIELGLYVWLGITLAPRLVTWAEQPTLESTSTARSSWQADRTLTLLRTIVPGLAAGLTAGLAFGLTTGLAFGLMTGLAFGLAFGPTAGLVMGNHHAWLVCTIAVAQLALKRQLPWRVMGFLDDAHRLGLLRAVGPVYQFRHAALHDHLASLK
ncbi:NACHT domain-containing protein [Nonomuraea turkmeniaca]|uniref:NACHT domain-containing protein n=1 Tax=Nonomuraea turkmeniaca TaxID=103838 RepID=UPI00147696A2|nr:NACHT domain-containing protein [Nonomuraea turkmeniaca]